MGNTHSGLNCSGKSKNKKKKKNRKNKHSNGTSKQLSDNLGNKNDAVDGLRTKSGDVTPRISQADKELVEERIKAIEKKHNDLQSRALLSFRKNDMLGSDLHDVRQEVDTYMAWLADQEKTVKRTTPLGYTVKDAEAMLTKQNDMCGELEERQATLNAVLHKAEGLLKDLPRKEREVVEKWVNMISTEHQRVYTMAVDKQKLIAESVQHRELFHVGLERVNLWLQAKEKELDDLQTIRLQSSDVEKQLDKCKTLESEVQGYSPNVQSLQRQVTNLEKECTPEKAAELQHKMTDVQSRYESLKTNMADTHNRLKDSAGQRKLFESDVQKVDRWCKETEMKCAVEPCVDCAIEVLDDQYKHYKTLDNTSRMFESLVKEIGDRGQTFYGPLYEADKFKLDNTLKTTSDKYEKVDSLVKSRLQTLECAINMRSQVSDEIAKANELLSQVQDDLRKANKPIGPTSEDAERSLQQYEAIAEKIAQYQPSITQLNQAIERLRNTGQNSEAEEILQITAQYELLEDQIEQQCRKCQHSMALREQYAEQTTQVQALMEECKKEIAEIGQQGQSLPVRMEKLKAVSDKLASAEPLLAVVGDKAQQIGIESNSVDARKVMDDIHTLRSELEQLKKTSDKKAKQCEAIQRNREDYEATINEATMWLEQKEDVLASCSMLDMTPEKVDQAMDKHKTLAKEALDKLDLVKDKAQLEKAHYEKLEEPMPLAVVEKLEQIHTLEDSIKTAIAKKEAYLDEAKADRLQLNMSMKQITEWISGAEDMLDSGYEGLDYDTLNDTLSEHKDYFSEASMCQDEMEQVMELSERLLPTLDGNDKETLRQTLINTNQKLANVMASSQRKQQLMEQKTDDYQDYQELMYHVTEAIQEMEEEWTQLQHLPTTTPEDVHKQQEATKEFLAKVDEMRPTMNDLNDKARELEKLGNTVSRGTINKYLTGANDRWNNLVCETENKQMSLQDLGAQWEDYNTLVYGVETLLQEAEEALPNVDIENSTGHELVTQLNDTKGICSQLEISEPKITALKRAAQNLQRSLPTAEAKVQSQEQVMALLEKLERIQDAAHEKEAALEEEIDDRAGFQTEADQTVAWLAETKTALVNMDPGKEVSDVMEKMEKQKVLEQEIAIRMEQMRHMGQLQETKYTAMGKEVPVEMKMQMASMRELEADVSVAMKAKEEELQHIKEDREEVTAALRDASAWLGEAELRLQERIIDIPDSQQRHQDLQSEFNEFKQVLDKLRTKGSDLIKHTPDSIEKQIVQKALADTNRQWLALQAKSAERSRKLTEAEQLTRDFDEVAGAVSEWLGGAKSVVKTPIQYGHFDKVREQLRQHRRVGRDIDYNLGRLAHLSSVTKQMALVCDASSAREQLAQLNQQVYNLQTETDSKLSSLEETNEEIEDFEAELSDLRQWMDDTRAQLTMRDASLSLKEQLAVQEKLLEDIDSHKGKALLILQKQAELESLTSEGALPPADKLGAEITSLQQTAREQCSALRDAVNKKEEYDQDLEQLTSAISEAQEKLLSSPVNPSDVNALKKQIAEHNALAVKIKSYQAKVQDINKKSQLLSEESLNLGPNSSDKLCEMGYYPHTLSGLRVHVRPDTSRSGLDSGVSMSPITANTSPRTFSSETDVSVSTVKSAKLGASLQDIQRSRPYHRSKGDLPLESPRSISGQSDDTDMLMDDSIEPVHVQNVHHRPPSPTPHDSSDNGYWSHQWRQDDSSKSESMSSLPSFKLPLGTVRHGRPVSPTPFDHSSPRYRGHHYAPPPMVSLSPSHSNTASPRDWRKPKLTSLYPYADMDLSASVPNLLSPLNELEPRERSASFGSKRTAPRHWPLSQSRDSRLAELNASWNCLQQQLGAKEQELQQALHKQERYQQCVQEVTAKMDQAQHKLSRGFPTSLGDLDRQVNDYRAVLLDIEGIKDDLGKVKERGRQVVEMSDPEGYKAMQATITMLSDRVQSLQSMADNKGRQLQTAMKDKEKHNISMNAYKKQVKELEDWLEEMKIRQSITPLPTDTVDSLRQNLNENQTLQNELNQKLQQISDLAVQCDNLCELETPANAEKLKSQLTNLQTQLGNLKLASIEKQGPLRSAIKESERRKKEMDEYESNVKKLQQWVSDTKQLTMVPSFVEPLLMREDQQDLQQKLRSDLSQHRQLVRQLSSDATSREPRREVTKQLPTISEDDLKRKWEEISAEMADRKQSLKDLLQQKDSVDGGQSSYPSRLSSSESWGQLKDVRQNLAELSNLWQQLNMQVQDKQVRLDKALDFQQKYQDALQGISSWLDLAEQKLFSPGGDMDAQQRVRENENLQREIKMLQNEIAAMGRSSQDLLSSVNKESQTLVKDSLANLNDRVHLLEEQARDQGQQLQQVDRQWQQYQDDMRNLQRNLADVRATMADSSSSTPLDQLISNMQKIEAQLKKCEGQLEEVKRKGEELSALAPQMVSTTELNSLQSNYLDLQRKVMDKKADLLQTVSVQDQYEKMLMDYAEFLETAQDKLKPETISARDLDHLKEQLNAHKDFFSDLEVHRAMLDSLANQSDKATQTKHAPQHQKLTNLTYVIQDKASLLGQKLDRLVRQWTELSEKQVHLTRFLDQMEEEVPIPVSSTDSVLTIQDKLGGYQRVQSQMADEKPTLYQVMDKGKQLLHSITCPPLESSVAELGDRWVTLNSNISHELKRTETLGGQLQAFEGESIVFSSWLTAAKQKLAEIKHLSDQDQQSIATIRNKVEKLLEFKKEVEVQEPLKNKITQVGGQLSQNRTYTQGDFEPRLAWFEEQWATLNHDIGKAEEYLHQSQMDLMPSRQALHELGTWLTLMEKAVSEEKNRPVRDKADIEILLKKFKDFKIDLQNKQLTVDFVNQSSLQSQDGEGDQPVSSDKTEFAERLGGLNKRWEVLSQDVSERLKTMETLHTRWAEYDRGVTRIQEWLREQEDKIKKHRLIGHEVSIRQSMKDCKVLKQSLEGKAGEIKSVQGLGQKLVDLSEGSPGCQESIISSLDHIDKQWRHLQLQTAELQTVLQEFLSQWQAYHQELQNANQILSETDYCLSRYNLVGGDITTLKMQVDKLKSLVGEVERGTAGYERLVTLGNQLIQVCEVPVRQEIQKTLADVQGRWSRTSAELQDRSARFEECLQQWQQFEDEHIQARRWLDNKEKLCNELVAMKEDSSRRDECLQRSKGLQKDLDNFQTQLSSLYQLSDDITKNMDTSSIVGITSRQSALESRVMAMRQILAKQVQALQGDLSQRQRFSDLLKTITAFLEDAERTLGDVEMNKSHDDQVLRERHEELKHLMTQFNNNMTQLDALNDLGYRMALSEEKSLELRELNHKWQRLYSECKERNKTLQGIILIQQDFSEKCDAWMTFLAQTEHDLSTEIASNLPDLVIQQRNCEKFESDMYSKQQILHAIITDGQKMMKDGEVDNKEEFQQKLHLLAEQWQSVVRRANQRKAIIDNTIKQWQAFNELTERLRDWLTEKEFGLRAFELDLVSLQKIKNLLDKARHIQTEFKLEEDTLHKMQEQSKQLMTRADNNAGDEIKVCTAQVTQYWYQIHGKLEDHCNTLEEVLKQWQECEEDIEDILLWLKDTRKALSADLPTSYDQLQAELHRCKDIESAFDNSEDKRQTLLAKEKKLAEVIQPDDLNVLHQRVRLLNKQWFELRNQAALRCQRINDNCLRWSSFNDRVKDLHDWIDQMEVKVISTKEHHIEDLLTRLQKDFREEMAEKERDKNRLDRQGRDLMKVSSEVRSADIENRLQRLDEKWQHLVSVLGFRQRKLQETLLAVQQLDISMANLRKWLSNMEHDLSEPVIYQESDRAEIQLKLRRQQELQTDIEHHSAGVGSVLNLCEVLLHDNDACPTEVEFNALQTAMKNLDRRWRHICQLSPDRRKRIEETWDLWQNLMDDCKSFDDWLRDAELEVRESAIDQIDATSTKDEIKRFEDLQRKVHENLSVLESINKQYRRLAREGRTDHSRVLKQLVEDANNRWDKLQQHVSAIMRRLKHSASLREDFTNSRDSLYTWLTEVDMQLTNVEHLSTMDIPAKVEEMKGIQDDISEKQKKIAYLDQSALYLIQKGDSMDAIRVQKELEDFKQYARSVFGRVDRYDAKLKRLSDAQDDELSKIPRMPDELDELERQLKANHPPGLDWQLEELEAYLESSPPESPPEKRRTTGRGILQDRPLSPVRGVSVTSSPRRSTSPMREKSVTPLRTSSPASRSRSRTKSRSPSRYAQRSPIRSPRMSPTRSMTSLDSVDAGMSREERRRRMREEIANRSQEAKVEDLLESLVDALEEAKLKLRVAEREVKCTTPKGLGVDSGSEYTKMMLDCERAVEKVRRLDRLAKSETGLSTIPSADEEVLSVLHRWEQLQAQNIEKDYRITQHRQEWHQFKADLDNMLDWLDSAEAMQARRAELPDDIVHLDSIIRQHKDPYIIPLNEEDFLLQLESKKARVLSINLLSKNFIDIRTDEGRLLKEKVRQMNRRWDSICAQATHLQKDLQLALMQCQEFHHTIHDLLLWLENIETKLQQNEPINLGADESALWSRLKKLKELKSDLENNQPRVISLKETADQLLMNTDSTEMVNAKDKMHIIANRLRALLRLCSSYITSLESRLDDVAQKSRVSPLSSLDHSVDSRDLSFGSQSPRNTSSPRYSSFRPASLLRNRTRSPITVARQLFERITGSSVAAASAAAPGDNLTGHPDEISSHPGLFRRVLRTALPLQVLLLLLLGVASLVPMCEDDYSCVLMNNFRRSLDPMLRYMDGPPPT